MKVQQTDYTTPCSMLPMRSLPLKALPATGTGVLKLYLIMHYIKTDIINRKYSKLYNTVLEVREDSDYEDFYIIDKAEVDSNFIQVGEFIGYAELFIAKAASDETEI